MRSALLLLLASAAVAQTTDQTGTISGVVTDAVTHMPVKKTLVSVNPIGNFGPGGSAAMTDAGGSFTIANLPAGQYRLTFQHENYPQSRFRGVTKKVDVKSGETTGPVTMELIPGASVTGRVVDEDGDPLPNCDVRLHPARNPEQGVPMTGNSASNEDGEYRAFGIAPGKYILSVECGQPVFQARPLSAGPDPPPTKAYPTLFYPLTTDSKSAQVVELTAGTEKSGIDFQMAPAMVTQVRGSFSPGGADWRGRNLTVQLSSPERHRAPSVDMAKGTFEFHEVFPGSYTLVIASIGGEDSRIGSWQHIDVGDRPVDLKVELRHGIDLTGKVEIESNGNSTNPLSFNQIVVELAPDPQSGLQSSQDQVSADGTFTLKGVLLGLWRLQLNAPSAFLKAAWLGSADVRDAPLDLTGGAGGALRIVVSTNTATIRGSAPVGEMVNAQRIESDSSSHIGWGAQADQNGQYKVEGLPPGKYRVMPVGERGPAPDEGGQEVTVREGETVTLDIKPQTAQ